MSNESEPLAKQGGAKPAKASLIPTGIYWASVGSLFAFPLGLTLCGIVTGDFQLRNAIEGLGLSFLLVLPLLLCGGIFPVAVIGTLAALLSRKICGADSKRLTLCCAALGFTGDLLLVIVLQVTGFFTALFYIP